MGHATAENHSNAPSLLCDVEEVRHLLQIGRSQLYLELTSGRLRSIKIGRRRLIPRQALEEYIEGLQDAAT